MNNCMHRCPLCLNSTLCTFKSMTTVCVHKQRILIEATPAKWKVLRVIWVPGSPILWALTAPTAVPVISNNSQNQLQ